QHRYREAILELQNGLRANPPNRNYFENLIGLAEKAQQLQNLYTRATTEESKGQLDSALVFFEQIYQSDPAFGNVEQKISQLRSRLVAENAKKSVAPLYEQATRYEKRGKFEAAIAVYESVLSKFPNDKIAQRKLEKARQNFLIRSRQRMLKSMYAAGMKALQKDDLTRAIVAFEEILALDANYKDTGQRLAAARKKIESKTTEAVVFRQYDDGMKAWNDGRYEQALSAFKKAQTIDPRYEDVAVKIAKVEQKLREQGNDISGIYLPKEIHAKKDSLFEIADAMVEKQKWHAALNAYEQIRTISPEDVIAIEQIAQLRAKLNVAASQTVQSGHDGFGKIILFAGGAVAFLIILPLVSAFTFAPTVRMRYFLMVGNLLRAANIIERLLDQNPGRLKLYPILANIYLLNQRRDAKAIKVYRTVARLNLARQNKQAIESMLAQYYMVESGETDQEALRILEDRLQDELRKRAKS
ncbi:MAG: tetratricopeptide repeat protein, partial [bacterium]